MFRDIIRKSVRTFREKFAGASDMQQLIDRGHVKMSKTREYLSDDEERMSTDHPWGPPGNVKVWSYRFKFDNQARKRAFMSAVKAYPPQHWDDWVRWMDDISNYDGEICVEAMCRVPPEEAEKFRYKFEQFATQDLIVKG